MANTWARTSKGACKVLEKLWIQMVQLSRQHTRPLISKDCHPGSLTSSQSSSARTLGAHVAGSRASSSSS